MSRTKQTHGFPELDFETTQQGYIDAVKASAAFTIENLKRTAEEASFAVKHLGRDPSEYFQELVTDIDNLTPEHDLHEDCVSQSDHERMESDYDDVRDELNETKKKLAEALHLLQECEDLVKDSPKLQAKVKEVIYA